MPVPRTGRNWLLLVNSISVAVALANVPISGRSSIDTVEIAFNPTNGDLYVLTADRSQGWSVARSIDAGANWFEVFNQPVDNGLLLDAAMATTASHLYVCYLTSSDPTRLALRRLMLPSGAFDRTFGVRTVKTAVSGTQFTSIVAEQNADALGSEVYIAAVQSDGVLRLTRFTDAANPIFFNDDPPVSDAARGLDLHWNANHTAWSLFATYIAADDDIHVVRGVKAGTFLWRNSAPLASVPASVKDVAVAARDDTVLVVFEDDFANGRGVRCLANYSGGDGAYQNHVLASPGPGEGDYKLPDISGRGGVGFAALYAQESGVFDPIYATYRLGFDDTAWAPATVISTVDTITVADTSIGHVPATGAPGIFFGAVYLNNSRTPYFAPFNRTRADMNCDGAVNTADIDDFVLALVQPNAYRGQRPNCRVDLADINCDGAVNTLDIDAFVDCLLAGCAACGS